jgi:adenine-specific DNA methylase
MIQIEKTIIAHAQQALREMRAYAADDRDSFIRAYHELGVLTQLGMVHESGLSDEAIKELDAIERESCAVLSKLEPSA